MFGFLEPISQSLELAFVERWRFVAAMICLIGDWQAALVKFEESLEDKHPKVSLNCIFDPSCPCAEARCPAEEVPCALLSPVFVLMFMVSWFFFRSLHKYLKYLDGRRMQAVCSRGTVLDVLEF